MAYEEVAEPRFAIEVVKKLGHKVPLGGTRILEWWLEASRHTRDSVATQ